MMPPKLSDGIVVYVSAPLFNLAETLYAVGIQGITPQLQESLVETICLPDQLMQNILNLGQILNLPEYGIAGLIAQKGWTAYIPARDGFILAKFINAVLAESGQSIDPTQVPLILSYLIKAIYGNDVFALGAMCNVCIFNGNGLQMDDGSATEVGMVGVRGLPTVIFRDQLTDQFGPGASNPMPLGNSSPIITQRAFSIQGAISMLDQKIKNIQKIGRSQWWSGLDYTHDVPPPPLVQFWLEVGAAVYFTKYKTKTIYTDQNGVQDAKRSCTDFYYQNFHVDGSSKALATIAVQIMKNVQAVEAKWATFIPIWGGCPDPPSITLQQIQNNPYVCAPPY